MKDKSKILNFEHSLAQFVSKDIESANEFLETENIKFNELAYENLSIIHDRLSEYKLNKGNSNTARLKSRFYDFLKIIEGQTLNKIQELYPSLPQVAYRKFEEDNLSKDEAEDLLKDASFLEFLTSEFENDSEQK